MQLKLPKKCPICGESLIDTPSFLTDEGIFVGTGPGNLWLCMLKCSQSECNGKVICGFRAWAEYSGGTTIDADPRVTQKYPVGFGNPTPAHGSSFSRVPEKPEFKQKLVWVFPSKKIVFDGISEDISNLLNDAFDNLLSGKLLGAAAYARTCLSALLAEFEIPEQDEKKAWLSLGQRLKILKSRIGAHDAHVDFLESVAWLGKDFLHLKFKWESAEVEKVLNEMINIIFRLTEGSRLAKMQSEIANMRGSQSLSK